MNWLARIALCALLAVGPRPLLADDRYRARFSEDLRTVDAELCFHGDPPDRLYRSSRAAPYASPIHRGGVDIDVRERGRRVDLPRLPRDTCLQWRVDLGRAADSADYRTAFRAGDAVLADTGLWFWKGPWRRPLVAEVTLPKGVALSTPWPPDPRDPTRYRPLRTPSGWTSRSAVGRFTQHRFAVPGSDVRVALLGHLDTGQQDTLTRFIRRSVDAVTPVFGRFPRRHVQVVVVPLGRRGEPVPWAHVIRGGGPSVQFYVDPTRPLAEFDADWTATHEFSHLLAPYVARQDRWLSEGLASYYQNVLRARDGRLDEREAWQAMAEGFRRGLRATRRETLERAMERGSGTMRVYWTGAAMMLQADVALRRHTDNAQSLDTALAGLMDCCFSEGRHWRARELLETLDRVSGTDVFMSVYRDNNERMDFPDFASVFAFLGVVVPDGGIRLEADAPGVAVRRAIMEAPGGSSTSPVANGAR